MPALRRISYEVHVQRGAHWETYARYGADGQGGALFRARCLVRHPLVDAVRVIKKVYDPISEEGHDFVVFKARNDREAVERIPDGIDHSGSEEALDPAASNPSSLIGEELRIPRRNGRLRILVEVFAAWPFAKKCGAGAVFAALAAALLTVTTHLISSETTLPTAPFGQLSGLGGFLLAALLIFGFCAIPMLLLTGVSRSDGSAMQSPSVVVGQEPTQLDTAPDLAASGFSLTSQGPPPPHADEAPPAQELAESRSTLLEFMQEGMHNAEAEHDLSDNHVRFGISLFLAGAAEHLAQTRDLDPGTTLLVVSGCAKSLGFGTAQAESFARRYVEHLMADSRFMDMFIAGRDAMAADSAHAEGSNRRLAESLALWAEPNPPEPRDKTLAVMCAAPAEDQQRLAEWASRPATEIVRKQRATLAEFAQKFGGKPLRPSGNAMTIVFPGAFEAVKAACAVFKHLLSQQATEARQEVPFRIGINVGEPVFRGQSVDGATMQLAAQICESAELGQILASKAVFSSCAGRQGLPPFSACGRYILKGFGEPIPLYEASWRELLAQDSEPSHQRKVASGAPDDDAPAPQRRVPSHPSSA